MQITTSRQWDVVLFHQWDIVRLFFNQPLGEVWSNPSKQFLA